MPATATQPTREDFAAMLEESFGRKDLQEGAVVKESSSESRRTLPSSTSD